MLSKIVHFLGCLLLVPSVATAGEPAPLPRAFEDQTVRRQFEVYDAVPNVRGTYAHGVAEGLVFADTNSPESVCAGSDEERRALLEKYRSTPQSEYWFYGTASQGVLFVKETRRGSGPSGEALKCSDAVWTSFQIERAYVANGFIHNFLFDEHTVPGLGSYRLTRTAGEYSGSFMRLQTLMAREEVPDDKDGRRWTREIVAGVPAICDADPGIVWNSTCYASQRKLRGMLLRSAAGDDIRTMFENRILEVRSGALLPGVVFEVDRDWALRPD